VEGIISSKLKSEEWSDPEGTSVLLHVLRELERLGYQATAGVFSAAEVGAPHQRKRVFILGVRDDFGESGMDFISSMLRSTRADAKLAYPAPRGAEQYAWEPRRVTVVHPQHNGPSSTEKQRGSDTTSNDCTERTDSPSKLERTSEPRSSASIQTNIAVDHTNQQGLLRDYDEPPNTNPKRRENEVRHNAQTSTPRRGVQGKTESEVGRDADGTASGLDYAQLSESCDNRTDELRLLGNGVVPATAERAFRTLWKSVCQ
jgi:DNA (cytosine-5)-methyltransferase 1